MHWTNDESDFEQAQSGAYQYRVRPANPAGDTVGDDSWLAESRKLPAGAEEVWFSIASTACPQAARDQAEAHAASQEEYAAHLRELAQLDRTPIPLHDLVSLRTPWGVIESGYRYGADGVLFLSTAGHGGYWVSQAKRTKMPRYFRNRDGFYEEEAEWAKVALAFPALFTSRDVRNAEAALRNHDPDLWEIHYGRKLLEGESLKRDRASFDTRHQQDYVATSARTSQDHPGFVEATASLGGRKGGGAATQTFLVAASEYAGKGRFGFVIDPSRHEVVRKAGVMAATRP